MISATDRSGRGKRRRTQTVRLHVVVELRLPPQLQGAAMPTQQEFAFSATLPGHQSPSHFTSSLPEIVAVPRPATPAAEPELPSETLEALYRRLLLPGEQQRNEAKTVSADLRRICDFESWLLSRDLDETRDPRATRITTPRSALDRLRDSAVLQDFARHLRNRTGGSSTSTAMLSLNTVCKLCRALVAEGLLKKMPKAPTRGDLNLMVAITETTDEDLSGEPVTLDELRALVAQVGQCEWPELRSGDTIVTPDVFWRTVLLSSYVYGYRTADWISIREPRKKGLLWSGVITETACPKIADLEHAAGWVSFLVHKTKKKCARAGRSPQQLLPLPRQLRELLEKFRGLDSERVFPLPMNPRAWTREWKELLSRAGLDDAARKAAKRPAIKLSEGKRSIASFRKGCASLWEQQLSTAAASYVLKHSSLSSPNASGDQGGVSQTTTDHYLQQYRILRKIAPAIESLPLPW